MYSLFQGDFAECLHLLMHPLPGEDVRKLIAHAYMIREAKIHVCSHTDFLLLYLLKRAFLSSRDGLYLPRYRQRPRKRRESLSGRLLWELRRNLTMILLPWRKGKGRSSFHLGMEIDAHLSDSAIR